MEIECTEILASHAQPLPTKRQQRSVVGEFGVSEVDSFTEPSAVAPDAGVNFRIKQGARQRELDKLYAAPLQRNEFSVNPCIVYGHHPVDSSIRRYRARFCKSASFVNSKLTHYRERF